MIVRLIPLLILVLFRFYDLGIRPPHHDESVNGWFVDGILSRGFYVYDPQNYHGPFFFYVLTLFEKVFGRNIEALRIPTVLFGSAIVFTPFLFRRWLGSAATFIAASMLAVSPALVFYSRYSIHETLFAFSMILFFYNWLRVREEGFSNQNILGFGLTLGLMASLKENFVLFGACLGLSEALIWVFEKKSPVKLNARFGWSLLASFGIAFLFIVVCFTGFFQDAEGVKKFFRAFLLWSETGTHGNGHQKPFYYWINLFAQYEWPALMGILLSCLAFKKVPSGLRLLSVMSLIHFLVYSAVNYKTPWCMLSFYWGLILVSAYWLGLWYENKGKVWVVSLLIVGMGYQGYLAFDASYVNPDADGHPYIYGQTYHDMMEPLNEIVRRGREAPELHETLSIQVISSFTWPMPYVLGEFKRVGYFGEQNAPQVLDAPYIIMDQAYEPKFAPRIQGDYTRTVTRSRQWAEPVVFFQKR